MLSFKIILVHSLDSIMWRMATLRALVLSGIVSLVLVQFLSSDGLATPLLALKEADNCAGCHKSGRSQKPFLFRRCTLDCQGCHVDPSGAGPRNQWGYYYTQAAAGVAALNYYEPADPLQNNSRYDLHFDSRIIRYQNPEKTRVFPMNAEASLRVRPFFNYLHFTYQAMFLGRIDDEVFRVVREGDRRYREKYSVMVDEIPLNTYLRAYRGQPMYGLRRPNHSLWIRERIGLDQFATTDAVEVGVAPNVPYFHASYMQGDPYVGEDLRQKGFSYHAGLRGVTLGWHVNVSGWSTKSKLASVDMHAVGAGMNVFGLILYAERNTRSVKETEESKKALPPDGGSMGRPIRVQPSSIISEYTAALALIPGVMFGGIYEKLDDDQKDSERKSAFVDLHPIPNLQLEYWRRYETGSRRIADNMAIAHWYFDF